MLIMAIFGEFTPVFGELAIAIIRQKSPLFTLARAPLINLKCKVMITFKLSKKTLGLPSNHILVFKYPPLGMILRKCLRTLPHQACRVLSGKGDSGSKYRSTVGRKGANPRLDDVTNEKSLETASLFSDDVPVPENEPEFDLIAEEGIFAEELPMFAGEIPIPSGKIPTPSKKNPVGAPAEKYIRKEQEVEIQKSVTKFGNTYEPFTNNSMYLKTVSWEQATNTCLFET